MSNLLVGVSSFSLDGLPDIVSEENKGSMTLEFFVEGLNYQKITALRAILATKYDLLQKSTKEKGSICTKAGSPLCNETTTANAIASIK